MTINHELDKDDLRVFESDAKVGLLATVNPQGLPHITFIATIQAKTPRQLIWGQFTEGLSKQHLKTNPHAAFLIMSLNKELWRGKAQWTHERKEGEEYELFNNKPMFRYNAYFGIHTVHYMDLVEVTEKEKLDMARIVRGVLQTKLAKGAVKTKSKDFILKPWAEQLFNKPGSLKFLAYVGDDGFPTMIPVIQCEAADSRRLAFSPVAYKEELLKIPAGETVALFGLTLNMEDVLIRGTFGGYRRYRGVTLGTVDIEWVYNSMPPKPGQIYPVEPITPVTDF